MTCVGHPDGCTKGFDSYTNWPQYSAGQGNTRRPGGNQPLYFRPTTINAALEALADRPCQILSGGTDFYPSLGDRCFTSTVVDIAGLTEIKGISLQSDHVRIGGLTTWTEVIDAPLPRCFDALKSAAREVGSVQIQNRGTVAGNLCNASPAADGVPPLLALDAVVELVSTTATRQVSLAEFLVGNRKTLRRPDEILAHVIVPRRLQNAASTFLKLGARRYLVISISMVATVIELDNNGRVAEARIAVGACSAKAQRLRALEQDLVGTPGHAGLGANVAPKHLAQLSPIDDVRATAAYRNDAALSLVRRSLDLCVGNC
jgi:CO/xanthine dehydrogenase FAD-binding subunit